MQNNLILIFSKVSAAGKVKTRLEKQLGTTKALEIHNRLFAYTIDLVKNLTIPFIIYHNENPTNPMPYEFKTQNGADLGEKMHNSFTEELINAAKICIIGSDCLELKPNDLKLAFQQLSEHDVVLGPAKDGGYYLIGLKKPCLNLFNDISWGSASVMKETLARCNANKLTYYILEPHNDIDRPEDVPTSWL